MARFPHESLPEKHVSLSEFTNLMADTLLHPDDIQPFIELALCGRYKTFDEDGSTVQSRLYVNPRAEGDNPDHDEYSLVRDFDSAIGVTRNLPFTAGMNIYPVPSFRDTLKRSNHLTGPVMIDGLSTEVPLHRIPNCALGTVGRRHISRVCFPALYRSGRSVVLTPNLLSRIYNECIKPAVATAVPEHMAHWPPDYDSALRQARDMTGRLHFGSIEIPSAKLVAFTASLLGKFEAVHEFKGAFFIHELRGSKGGTMHDGEDEEARQTAYDDFTAFLDLARLKPDEWSIDVALEIRRPGYIVQWLESSHLALLAHILPSASDRDLQYLRRSKYFYKDHVAQFNDFAGFRLEPRSKGRADNVHYINIYTTDKSVSYQLHKGIFRRRTAADVLPDKLPKLLQDLSLMSQNFAACLGTEEEEEGDRSDSGEGGLENDEGDVDRPAEVADRNMASWGDDIGQVGTARLEIRVPLSVAGDVLHSLPEALVASSVACIAPNIWWMFKFYRLAGINYVLEDFHRAKLAGARALAESLTLGAACVYMLNSLNYRPAGGVDYNALLDLCCYQRPEEEDEDEDFDPENPDGNFTPVLMTWGLYFLSGIAYTDEVPRMAHKNCLPPGTLAALYGRNSMADIYTSFQLNQVRPRPEIVNRGRIRNRRRRPLDITELLPVEQLSLADFVVDGEEIVVQPPAVIRGDDVILTEQDFAAEPPEDQTAEQMVARIWRQYAFDIFEHGPNMKKATASSHILLSAEDRQMVTHDIFCSHDLTGIFERVALKLVTSDAWDTTHFGHWFPPKGAPPVARLQGYPSMKYYQEWADLMNRVSTADSVRLRGAVLKKFKTLHWLPLSASDRAWVTRRTNKPGVVHLPSDMNLATVQIGVNDRHCKTLAVFTLEPAETAALDREGSVVEREGSNQDF